MSTVINEEILRERVTTVYKDFLLTSQIEGEESKGALKRMGAYIELKSMYRMFYGGGAVEERLTPELCKVEEQFEEAMENDGEQ